MGHKRTNSNVTLVNAPSSKRLKLDVNALIGEAVRTQLRKTESYTKTKTKKKKSGQNAHTRTLGHGKVGATKIKVKPIKGTKPKGVTKSFVKKVEAVTTFKKGYGILRKITQMRLRQTDLDEYGVFNTDEAGVGYDFFNIRQAFNAHDMLWNSKTRFGSALPYEDQWNTTTIDRDIKVLAQSATFFFKSTSSHVVNIEMYVGYRKSESSGNSDKDLKDQMIDALDDFVNMSTNHSGDGSWNLDSLGMSASFLPNALNEWKVQKRVFKVPPGHTHTEHLKGPNRTYVGATHINDSVAGTTSVNPGNFPRYQKGSVNVFFRVINDVTVSGGGGGQIHHWPSNTSGGVALSVSHDIKVVPLDDDSKNTICILNGRAIISTSTDQQVPVDNPPAAVDV